ncbi:MAG TPA: hypothetical protein VNL91_11315 [Thermoanaerobaculia bacterium]|nr:hypothetical protein [Thermoanaerobaculia bacterium]
MELSEFTAEAMRPHVGSTFRLVLPDGEVVDLKLTEVVVRVEKRHSPRLKRDSFSLFFTGPRYLRQGIYPARHEQLGGPWPICFVPLGKKEDGTIEFEAVFT